MDDRDPDRRCTPTVPLQRAEHEGERRALVREPDGAPRTRARRRVVVVDDSPVVRHFLASTLVGAGHEVLQACDGAAGLRLLQDGSTNPAPDLVITDVDMPRLSGLDMLAELRASGSRVPAITITGDVRRAVVERAAALGAAVFEKPLLASELLAAVASILSPA